MGGLSKGVGWDFNFFSSRIIFFYIAANREVVLNMVRWGDVSTG
jgi:hypothetical protein